MVLTTSSNCIWMLAISLIVLHAVGQHIAQTPAQQLNFAGDSSCPCLAEGDIEPLSFGNVTESNAANLGLDRINITSYGFGCAPHDEDSATCNHDADIKICTDTTECDTSEKRWCSRSWCFVDPDYCALLNQPSKYFLGSGRYYSFATCGHIDTFTVDNQVRSLSGKTIKIGLNSNPGGMFGACQSEMQHFSGPLETWRGPILDFVLRAAVAANFTVELVEPPEILRNKSIAFWGNSPFDRCIYGVSLGYMDLCVSTYVVTSQRASVTPWIQMTDRSIYLVLKDGTYDAYFGWKGFMTSVTTIFLPFTMGTWLFLILFAVPLMGGLFVFHEYGNPNSLYAPTEVVAVADEDCGELLIMRRKVPMYHSITRSVYMGYLSMVQQEYSLSVSSPGAKMHLIGMASMILTIIAVYVANLTSILTQRVNKKEIASLDDAIAAGYRMCATRKMYEVVKGPLYLFIALDFYGTFSLLCLAHSHMLTLASNHSIREAVYNVPSKAFAVDPIELGGDGLPGFDCPNCAISTRGIEYLDPIKAETDDQYCHGALSFPEGLDAFHTIGEYCHLKFVGESLALVPDGLPVFDGVANALSAHFQHRLNMGDWAILRNDAKPPSACPLPKFRSSLQDASMNPADLAGIWSVSFLFVLVSFVLALGLQSWKRRTKMLVHQVHGYDQKGEPYDRITESDALVLQNAARCEALVRLALRSQEKDERPCSSEEPMHFSRRRHCKSALRGQPSYRQPRAGSKRKAFEDNPTTSAGSALGEELRQWQPKKVSFLSDMEFPILETSKVKRMQKCV